MPPGSTVPLAGTPTVMLTGCTAAPTAAVFIASTLLVGLTAVGTQMILPVVAHLAPEHRRGQIVGTVMSGLLFGILLSRPLATIVAGSFGWRAVFVMSAVLMCGVIALMAFALPRRQPQHTLTYGTLLGSLWHLMMTTRVLQRRSAYQCLLYGAFSLFWTAMPLVLEAPPFAFGHIALSAFLLSGAGGALLAPLAGRMSDRGRGGTVTLLAMLAVLVSFVLIRTQGSGPGSIALFVIAGILIDAGTQGNVVAGQRAIFALPADIRSRLNSLYLGSAFFGGALGSALSGYAASHGGTIAISNVGTSPMPQVMAPAICWSSSGGAPHSRPSSVNHSGWIRVVEPINVTPKKAWKAMVARSSSSRSGYGARRGTGSVPIIDRTNR